ncbi:MobV family relaxase [Blautia hominis]|uniref:MobV family relaxase n=2 Tax=Blautia hominis TaxID=2025493 RepID=A0ABQ0BHB7_9FIRM
MKRTISVMVGKGSVNHNSRKFHAKNTDPERSDRNVEYCNQDIREVYHELFDESLARYNEKQTRSDRRIDNYYEKICSGKQEKPFHEIILQIGNKDDMNVMTENGELAAKVLAEYVEEFQKRNPTLKVFSSHLHMDEATPHLHIDFVPFTTGSKRGLDTRVSLKQALAVLGFKGGTRSDTEWNQWVAAEKEQLAAVMQRHDIEWERKGTHEKHLSVLDFEKKEREKEVTVLEQEVDSLEAESAALAGRIAENRADIQGLDEVREEAEKVAEEAVERSEKAERQVKVYEKELDVIKPVMESIDRELKEFRGKIEDTLPPAATLERAASYRENKAKPLFIKMKNKIAALAARLTETMQELKAVKVENKELKEDNNLLFSDCNDLFKENAGLKNIAFMFERVVRVLGEDKVFMAVRQDEERERMEAERNRTEQAPKKKSVRKNLERAKENVTAREAEKSKKKSKSRDMER